MFREIWFIFYFTKLLNDTLEYDLGAVKNVFRSSYHVKIHESLHKTILEPMTGIILSAALRFYFTSLTTDIKKQLSAMLIFFSQKKMNFNFRSLTPLLYLPLKNRIRNTNLQFSLKWFFFLSMQYLLK